MRIDQLLITVSVGLALSLPEELVFEPIQHGLKKRLPRSVRENISNTERLGLSRSPKARYNPTIAKGDHCWFNGDRGKWDPIQAHDQIA